MTRSQAGHGRSRCSARRFVLAVVIALGSAITAAPASALTPHQRFIQQVMEQLPVLHVDRTDGFRPQNFKLVFDYRALKGGTQPFYTCLRYQPSFFRTPPPVDDSPCRAGLQAHLYNVGPSSTVDHIDYPAGFNTNDQSALANRYFDGKPVVYFFGKRDSANQKHYEDWFFYSYNYFVATQNLLVTKIHKQVDLHEGDLEHIIVYTNALNQPIGYTFFQHAGHQNHAPNDPALHLIGKDGGFLAGHVQVYAAHGSHASETGCGLFDNNVQGGQRDRTCVTDPNTDNVDRSGKNTSTYNSPKISNLDVANWACFGHRAGGTHRLGASHPDIGSNFQLNAPKPPLIQSNECPNLYERQASRAAVARTQPARVRAADTAVADDQTVEEPTPNALAGIDRCSDWEQPTLQPGFMVVACNQNILTQHFHPSASSPSAARVDIASSSNNPTGGDIPPYVNEPDAQALRADSITASTSTPVDVYVTETEPDGVTQLQALFPGIPASSTALHVDTSRFPWALVGDNGQAMASQNPAQLGCSLTGIAPIDGLLAGLPLVCTGLPAPLDVHITSGQATWDWQGASRHGARFVLVSIDRRNRRHVTQIQLRPIALGHHRFRAFVPLARGTADAGIGVMQRGRMSVSRLAPAGGSTNGVGSRRR